MGKSRLETPDEIASSICSHCTTDSTIITHLCRAILAAALRASELRCESNKPRVIKRGLGPRVSGSR